MLLYRYIASLCLEGQCAVLLELSCSTKQTLDSLAFQAFAQKLCRTIAKFAPKYLTLEQIPQVDIDPLREECRLTTLKRGIPASEREEYQASLLVKALAKKCLATLPLEPEEEELQPPPSPYTEDWPNSVGQAVRHFGELCGPIKIERFYRMSIED